jgi:hypothetical protein
MNNLVISENNYLEAETRRQRCLKEKFALYLKASKERLNNPKSKFIGIPGEHRVSKLKVESILHPTPITDTNRRLVERALVLFTDDQNNVYQWSTNNTQIISVIEPDEPGSITSKKGILNKKEPEKYESYYFTFAVKAHTEYAGIKHTVIRGVSVNIIPVRMKEIFRMLKEQENQ